MRVKTVATLGPSLEGVFEGAAALVDVVRLNFSHGDHREHGRKIKLVREVSPGTPVMLDTAGPEVRVARESSVSRGINSMELKLTPDTELREGDELLIDDGKFRARVTGEGLELNRAGKLRRGAKVIFTNRDIELPTLTEKDIRDIRFGLDRGIDMVALSFARSAENIIELNGLLEEEDALDVWVIPKIEHFKAVEDIHSIIKLSDGVMVARGDLAVYVPYQRVPLIQKGIIRTAMKLRRPSIVATQILSSMVSSPAPTRAEVSDIINAVLDGADALMLSNETAVGEYPVEALRTLRQVSGSVAEASQEKPVDMGEDLAFSACRLAERLGASIICRTNTGRTARRIVKFRPRAGVFVLARGERLRRNLNLLWGVRQGEPERGYVVEVDHLTENPSVRVSYLGKPIARGTGYGTGRFIGYLGRGIVELKSGEPVEGDAVIYRGRTNDPTFQEIIRRGLPMIMTEDPVPEGKKLVMDLDLGIIVEHEEGYGQQDFASGRYGLI